jgi:hypothetical protein
MHSYPARRTKVQISFSLQKQTLKQQLFKGFLLELNVAKRLDNLNFSAFISATADKSSNLVLATKTNP